MMMMMIQLEHTHTHTRETFSPKIFFLSIFNKIKKNDHHHDYHHFVSNEIKSDRTKT